MSKKLDISRRALTLLGLGAIVAVLAPISVVAATSVIKIQDGNGNSKAQVDGGSLRVGDGSGAITVNGTGGSGQVPISGNVGVTGPVGISGSVSTTGLPTTVLAQGDCDSSDAYTDTGVLQNGETVAGIVLSSDVGGAQINTLTVTAPSSTNAGGRILTLMDGQSAGSEFGEQVNFGPGLRLTENWSIACTGQFGSTQGNGLWIAYGF